MNLDVNGSSVDHVIEDFDVRDRWLRIFHVAGRERSLTAAGRALGIGQPSVSHAIRQLEKRLGVTLFDRSESPIALTPVGARLWNDTAESWASIDRAIRRVQARSGPLTLSVSTSFATWWLLPRLASFKAQHPDVELRCITSDSDDRVGRDHVDLTIPLGPGPWAGFEVEELVPERVRAVVAPSVAEAVDDLDDPSAIGGLALIHLEETYRSRFDWARWCSHHDVELPSRTAMVSNDYSLVVQAALDGQGVALGWDHIVGPLLDDGRLVSVGGDAIETEEPFVVIRRPGRSVAGLEEFRDWLRSTLADDGRPS